MITLLVGFHDHLSSAEWSCDNKPVDDRPASPQRIEAIAKCSHKTAPVEDMLPSSLWLLKESSKGPDFSLTAEHNPDEYYYHSWRPQTRKAVLISTYAAYLPHNNDYWLSNKSYIGKKPSPNNPKPFKIGNYPNKCKTKQYQIWDNLQKEEHPPVILISKYVAHYYSLEIKDITKEAKQKFCN